MTTRADREAAAEDARRRNNEDENILDNNEFNATVAAPDADAVPQDTATIVKCPACNGTGSVPENLIDGKVDKWKNCPMCNAKGLFKKETDVVADQYVCPECNGSGKTVDTAVEGVPETLKTCATCNGSGRKLPV